MNKKLENVLERHIDTIWAIAASEYVDQFVVGVTAQSSEKRFQQYRGVDFRHLVVLSNGWTSEEALWLEGALQSHCRDTEAHKPGFPDKYSRDRKSDVHRRSLGGKAAGEAEYLVYMAWWEPD